MKTRKATRGSIDFQGHLAVGSPVTSLRAGRSSCVKALAAIVLIGAQGTVMAQGTLLPQRGNATSLRELPFVRAMPLSSQSNSAVQAPDALKTPIYCDSETLRESATIRAIRFWDTRRGVAVGDLGCILVTHDGGQSWNQSISGLECRLNDVIWVSANRLVAVGGGFDAITRISRCAAVISNDAGRTWKRASDTDLPRLHRIEQTTTEPATATALAARGRKQRRTITAHGDPDPISGASMFESRDGGRSWLSVSDNQETNAVADAESTNPTTANQSVIRTTCQLSDKTLVCAGDHGTILRSTDDGQNWQTVHGDDASCAVLVIAGSPDQIPWSLIGRETIEKRLRTNLIVGVTDNNTDAIDNACLAQATMQLGAAAIDTYSSASRPESINVLKQWIDVHHPPILAIDASLTAEVKRILLQHSVANGTEKVIEYSRVDRGESMLRHSAMLPKSGILAGDLLDDCRSLVADFEITADSTTASAVPDQWISITTRYSSGNRLAGANSLGDSVRLTSKYRLPPRVSKASRRRLQVIQGRLKQQTTITDLFTSVDARQKPISSKRFTEAMQLLLDQTGRIDQFRSAWSIARQSIGKRDQSIVWDEISNRFAGSSSARLAGLHVRARRASREWERHGSYAIDADAPFASLNIGSQIAAQISGATPIAGNSQELQPTGSGHSAIVSPFQMNPMYRSDLQHGVIQASASLPLEFGQTLGRGQQGDSGMRNRSSAPVEIDLAWQMHPVRLIVEAAIARNQQIDVMQQAASEETQPESSPSPDTQTFSANLRRIADRKTQWASLLKPVSPQVATCIHVDSPPRLDGRLTEAFWNSDQTKPATTRGANELKIQLARDDQFVYIAIQGSAKNFGPGQSPEKVGQRDSDLSNDDRLSLALDMDRDLLTGLNIAMTRDGRTRDDLDGYDRWNPTWYVASEESAGVVTTEIAIEQSSLGTAIQPGDSWFIDAKTIASGRPQPIKMMPEPGSRIRVDFQ